MYKKETKKRSEYYNYYSAKTWGSAAPMTFASIRLPLGIEATVDIVEDFIARS